MKRFLIPFSLCAAFFLMISCGHKEPDYEQLIQDKVDVFSQFYADTFKDKALSDDQKDELIDREFDKLAEEVQAIVNDALKIHNSDTLAMNMVLAMYQLGITDDEGILGLIEKLGPEAQEMAEIQALKAECQLRLKAAPGTKFIDFAIRQPDGKVAKLSDYAGKGKFCLVDFWASWCGPCRREIPNLIEVYGKYAPKGLNMVSVAVWDKVADTKKAAEELGITWYQIVDAQKIPTELYSINGIPHIMLIGPDGTILARDLRGKKIQKELEKYF